MKKRLVSLLAMATMTATMFAACGSSDTASTETPATDGAATETTAAD